MIIKGTIFELHVYNKNVDIKFSVHKVFQE